MSEKIYACLLRLYPRHFRETYGDEALRLFRDRFGNEQGLRPRLRLWLDLLIDLSTSVPQEYRRFTPKLATASARQSLRNEHPAFGVLDGSRFPLRQVFAGGLLTLLSFLLILFSVGYGARKHLLNASSSQMQRVGFWRSLMPQKLSAQNSSDDSNVIILGKRPFGTPTRTKTKVAKPNTSQWDLIFASFPFSHAPTATSPASQQLRNWLAAYDGADWDAYLSFLRTNFAMQPEERFQDHRIRDQTGGFELKKIEAETPLQVTALIGERDIDQVVRIVVEVEQAEPHRIRNFHAEPIARPQDMALPQLDELRRFNKRETR